MLRSVSASAREIFVALAKQERQLFNDRYSKHFALRAVFRQSLSCALFLAIIAAR